MKKVQELLYKEVISEMIGNYIDNEECFGFHSEYYINPNWRGREKDTYLRNGEEIRKGYMEFSKYGENIYFLRDYARGVIFKCNPKDKTASAIQLNTEIAYDYIAVNQQGYFLYNNQLVSLFGFDGQEVYTHKFGQKEYKECIYVYDHMVLYSETKTPKNSCRICCVNMLSKEVRILWETQKGDSVFDSKLRTSYKEIWGRDLPFFSTPSNIGNISCEFLYANKKRVVAGYTKNKFPNNISYIINVDLDTEQWDILDCRPNSMPNARCIFSFNMINDTMWIKTDDKDIGLIHTSIQRISQFQENKVVEWRLCTLYNASYYYFDGKKAYLPENLCVYLIEKNGNKIENQVHAYQTEYFWCLEDVYTIPSCYSDVSFMGKWCFTLEKNTLNGLINNAKILPEEMVQIQEQDLKQNVGEKSRELLAEEEKHSISLDSSDSTISLVEFRERASQVTGFRNALLEYRKSLPNIWDYNAYVGILLGVGGPKHGDASCMNYAIGQGDNGNNTKKTLEERGIMQIFEKYKGKKIDSKIMLSEVEDEIVSIVPEYEQIRRKFHEITEV